MTNTNITRLGGGYEVRYEMHKCEGGMRYRLYNPDGYPVASHPTQEGSVALYREIQKQATEILRTAK